MIGEIALGGEVGDPDDPFGSPVNPVVNMALAPDGSLLCIGRAHRCHLIR